jgi:ubiquinone/menaquinone biosynthesis C-methylase UbiE
MSTATTQTVYGTAYGENAAENYERYFTPVIGGPFAADLVEDAQLQPGERVLDVACGTGTIARLAAERVGQDGAVSALDVNAAMLAVARAIPSAIPIKWYETSAESIPLPDNSFDVVFCGLGLQFFADQRAALRELRRVLVPGGRLHINTPRPNALFELFDREITRHMGAQAGAFVRAVFSLHDPQELHSLLVDAGFTTPRVRIHRKRTQLPAAREFMWQYIYCTPLIGLLPQVSAAAKDALEQAIVAGWQPWVTANGMRHEQEVLVGTAHK